MSIKCEMNIKTYIKENRLSIKNISQSPFSIEKYKKEPFLSNPDFSFSLEKVDSQTINREGLIEIFNSPNYDLYDGFILSMLWGGINHSRPRISGNMKTTNLYLSISHGRQKINNKLQVIERLLNEGSIEEAFRSMMYENQNKIPGIGISYFTKFLFFLGQTNDLKIKPLIYDKWTRAIHVLILLDEGEEELLNSIYSKSSLKRLVLKHNLIACRSGMEPTAYMDYIQRMNRISDEFKIYDSGKLEAYLFGFSKRIKTNNPRLKVMSMLDNYKHIYEEE